MDVVAVDSVMEGGVCGGGQVSGGGDGLVCPVEVAEEEVEFA